MSDTDKPGAADLKDLMRRVLDSNSSEAFEGFMLRQIARARSSRPLIISAAAHCLMTCGLGSSRAAAA